MKKTILKLLKNTSKFLKRKSRKIENKRLAMEINKRGDLLRKMERENKSN